MSKGQDRYKKGMPMTELETLIKSTDIEWIDDAVLEGLAHKKYSNRIL